ncbi:MAG TPA: HEAT repeat domain-containing protein [Tepidisphaeraceae bacterium]|jgi:hypothetical protein|nr:HEAT repeat domain-containing protein [Tepidisphaeraceae bacterium]
MPRKSESKTTAKKFSHVPPKAVAKAVEAAKPAAPAIPATAVTAEHAGAAKAVETKTQATPVIAAKPETAPTPVIAAPHETTTTPVIAAQTHCCHGAPTGTSACTSDRTATVAAAIAALHSDDADAARDAASTLGLLGDRSAVEPLVQVLDNSCGFFHSVVRAAAAESLGALGDARALEPLLGALTDPIAEVSSESIRALATLGNPEAIDALSDVVRNRAGFFLPVARQAAVLGLAKLGGDRALETLRAVAADDYEDSTIRAAAENALTQEATASAN